MIRKFEDYLDRVTNKENRLLIILLINAAFITIFASILKVLGGLIK